MLRAPLPRRAFIRSLSAAALAVSSIRCSSLAAQTATANQVPDSKLSDWPIAIFEKVFEGLNYEELANAVFETGADGIEATIRPGGHIEPAVAAEEVPKMCEALKARGKRIIIAATSIRRVDEPHVESLLKILKDNGITHYRMGHYQLQLNESPLKQVREFAAQAKELAALNHDLQIQGLYQNHSGGNSKQSYLGGLGWDAALLLEGIDPKALGLALDTRHLRKDTGSSWETAVKLCKPHVRSIYVKDGLWKGPRGDQYSDVPLDTGFVNKKTFDTIRSGLEPMPLCIHMEWLGYRVFEKHEIPRAVEAHQRDIATLKGWLKA